MHEVGFRLAGRPGDGAKMGTRDDDGTPPTVNASEPPETWLREAARVSVADAADLSTPVRLGESLVGKLLKDRFFVERHLGKGGMGEVFVAHDRKRDARVALKTLLRFDSAEVYRFKKEFRALAELSHPGLVQLHDLYVDDEPFLFTMDLIDGRPFDAHVGRPAPLDLASTVKPGAAVRAAPAALPSRKGTVQEGVLRPALSQLASAVKAMHDAGKVHRDLKPSNVLVTSSGRVVVLDFGLIGELPEGQGPLSIEAGVRGTPGFIAPEVLSGEPATEAADWYAVGVMLYLCLSGQLPYGGTPRDMMIAARIHEARPLSRDADLPPDLKELCQALLARERRERAGHAEIEACCGQRLSIGMLSPVRRTKLVGRSDELGQLETAYQEVLAGRPSVAVVHGASGVGKTALVEEFLSHGAVEATVVRGRCYRSESMPFKALDPIVDALSVLLRTMDPAGVERVLPQRTDALLRLFPVLERVEAIAARSQRRALPEDEGRVRVLGVRALEELFGRLSDVSPLVVFIDDVQWGDLDSARVLSLLLGSGSAPAMLVVLSARTGEAEAFFDVLGQHEDLSQHDIALEPLDEDSSTVVARECAPELGEALASDVVRRASGNPFLIEQFALGASRDAGATEDADAGVLARVGRLPRSEHAALELISLCGAPVPMRWVAELLPALEDPFSVVESLCRKRLLRAQGTGDDERLAPYHDRLAELVSARIDAREASRLHAALSQRLERESEVDHEALVRHLLGCGRVERAVESAARGVVQAKGRLAFLQAAALQEIVLQHAVLPPAEQMDLLEQRAELLALGGRGGDAAEAFELAARAADATSRAHLQRRAGEQLLLSGRIDQGMERLKGALASMPSEADRNYVADVIEGDPGRLILGKNRSTDRAAQAGGAEASDLYWSVAVALLGVDQESTGWVAMQLGSALSSGDTDTLIRALALYMVSKFEDVRGSPMAHGSAFIGLSGLAKDRECGPYAEGFRLLALGMMKGGFRETSSDESVELFRRAGETFRDRCSGAFREAAMAGRYEASALSHRGRWHELGARLKQWHREAEAQNNLFSLAFLGTMGTYLRLRQDEPGRARADLDRTLRLWKRQRFDQVKSEAIYGLTAVERYEGGTGRIALGRPDVPSARQGVVPRILVWTELGEAARDSNGRDGRLKWLTSEIERLSYMRKSSMWLDAVRAALCHLRGNHGEACRLLESAVRHPHALFPGYPAVLKRRRGELLGGDAGRRLVVEADEELKRAGIRNPAAWMRMYAPGFGRT